MEVEKKLSYWEYLEESYQDKIRFRTLYLKQNKSTLSDYEFIDIQAEMRVYKEIIKDLKLRR